MHWVTLKGELMQFEGPRHGKPSHIDEVGERLREWLYETGIRHVLCRTVSDFKRWLTTGRRGPPPMIEFIIGFYTPEDAFAFKMRWC
jgi:hypothetical protein